MKIDFLRHRSDEIRSHTIYGNYKCGIQQINEKVNEFDVSAIKHVIQFWIHSMCEWKIWKNKINNKRFFSSTCSNFSTHFELKLLCAFYLLWIEKLLFHIGFSFGFYALWKSETRYIELSVAKIEQFSKESKKEFNIFLLFNKTNSIDFFFKHFPIESNISLTNIKYRKV